MSFDAAGSRSRGKKQKHGKDDQYEWQPPIHPLHGTQRQLVNNEVNFYNLPRMRSAGSLLLAASVMSVCSLTDIDAGFAQGRERGQAEPAVRTDGRLRPGHLELMRVAGFPGKGVIEVSFFPTAICEDGCGARTFPGGKTNARGAARFRVRVPGTFIDQRNRFAYFRDGERIDVNVTWEGSDRDFAFASAEPEPIIVRGNGPHRG